MSAHEGFIAQLKSFVHELPEFILITVSEYRYLRKVYADNALVEASLELVIAVFVLPRRKEAPASHAAENVALVVFAHFLC